MEISSIVHEIEENERKMKKLQNRIWCSGENKQFILVSKKKAKHVLKDFLKISHPGCKCVNKSTIVLD